MLARNPSYPVSAFGKPRTYADLEAAVTEADDAYQAALEAEHGDNATAVRASLAGIGESGSPIRDAMHALSAYEDDIAGADEFRGCRPFPKRAVVLDQTGGRFR